MSEVEIDLENALPRWETLPDGRRAIVIESEFNPASRGGPRALLILPRRDGWTAAHLLYLSAEKIYNEVRAAERGDVWRGGKVIASPNGG